MATEWVGSNFYSAQFESEWITPRQRKLEVEHPTEKKSTMVRFSLPGWRILESIHLGPRPTFSGNEKGVEMTTISPWFNATVSMTTTDEPSEGNPGKAHQAGDDFPLPI